MDATVKKNGLDSTTNGARYYAYVMRSGTCDVKALRHTLKLQLQPAEQKAMMRNLEE